MSKKLRALLNITKSETTDSDFSVIPLNENLLQLIKGSNNNSCSNTHCYGGGLNTGCSNNPCSQTRDSGCTNHQ